MPSKSFKSKKSASRKQKKSKNTKRKTKSLRKSHQRGGSPASTLVMEATTQPPITNDYFPRTDSGNSGCLSGGTASDMVMANLTGNAPTITYSPRLDVKGNINSLNTYELTGGKRSNKKKNGNKKKSSNKYKNLSKMSKKNSKSGNNNNNHHKRKNGKSGKSGKSGKHGKHGNHMMKGGYGSAWIASQYSQGNINGSSMSSNTGDFSSSQGTARDMLMNPPTLGLAGSGSPMSSLEGANVKSIGAPLV